MTSPRSDTPRPVFAAAASGTVGRLIRALNLPGRVMGWRRDAIEGVRLRRAILEGRVLRGAMPLRTRTARLRATLADSQRREALFRDISDSYAGAVATLTQNPPGTRRITVDGLRWWVPLTAPDDEVAVGRYLRKQDFPYRVLTQTREAGLGGIMLDIGGNNGRMSIPRVVLGDVQLAYCAEPDPLNYACLVRNAHDNGLQGLVMPDRVAIGSEDGTVRLFRAKSPGGHKVVDSVAPAEGTTIDVPCFSLDSWCRRLQVDPDLVTFVKLDVQGSEVHVLRGAARLLASRHIAWQIEIDVELLRERGFGAGDLFGLFRRHFTHFVDLNRHVTGARVRSVEDLVKALAYLQQGDGGRTDVLLFNLDS